MIASNTNRRFLLPGVLGALLLLAPLAFTSCQPASPEIAITIESDYSQIIEAIKSVDKTLSQKLAAIESAMQSGFADSKAAQELIATAVASLSGTLEEKLAAIEGADRKSVV